MMTMVTGGRLVNKPSVQYVNEGEDDQMQVVGYRRNFIKTILTWIAIVLTGGILRLIFHWRPNWFLFCTHDEAPLETATKVLLTDHYNQKLVESVVRMNCEALNYSLNYSYQRLDFHHRNASNGDAREQHRDSLHSSEQSLASSKAEGVIRRPLPGGKFEATNSLTYFENKKLKYIWDPKRSKFLKLYGLDKDIKCDYFYHQSGLSVDEQDRRRLVYGDNSINVEVQTVLQILFKEVLEPFYVFQVFSIIVWCVEDYMYYATCIVIMSTLSLTSSVIQIRRNQRQLRDTVHSNDKVTVWRNFEGSRNEQQSHPEEIESSKLVPGDVILIPQYGGIMTCDAVLVSGNVIVNESMLTGESVPVTKTPLPNTAANYHQKEHNKHTLFCGTKVIQTRFYGGAAVKAVVIRCGYQTSKGELVRSIMFPKPVDFKFNRHIHYFVACLAAVASIGFLYTVVLKVHRDASIKDIILKALDLITIVVPPALPAAMTIGVIFAQSRLRRNNIFCISPRSINLSGCLNVVCFDKTGTLTEDDLNFSEVVPVDQSTGHFGPSIEELEDEHEVTPLMICLASCHSLTMVDNNLIGDPLDQKMFQATGWILEEPEVDDTSKFDLLAPTIVKHKRHGVEVGILRQFTFSSSLQRMSVVTRTLTGKEFELYLKGAPEMVASLCEPNTLPPDFADILRGLTQQGYRVLGLAYRPLTGLTYLKVQKAPREDLEKQLTFLGFLVMGNMLKPETNPTIQLLLEANIRPVMVTGDNMLTALSVARECLMIAPHDKVIMLKIAGESEAGTPSHDGDSPPSLTWNDADSPPQNPVESIIESNSLKILIEKKSETHIALTGRTFKALRDHYPDILRRVLVRGTVFARMAPEQKQQLIEHLQEIGYYVGMCGDGANDCGALKAAHTGVSLSEAEASVASPFTSKNANISCIPILIREGRASLVTAFGILKYMASYSLTQFLSVIILYTMWSNLTDWQFLYIDLFLITLFAALFGRSEAYDRLARQPPPSSLIGIAPLASIAIQISLVTLFQLMAIAILWQRPWYLKHEPRNEDDFACHDNYAVFAVSVFQYITLAVIFAKGAPYRKPLYTNYMFLTSLIVMTLITAYLVLYPHPWLADHFELKFDGVVMEFRIAMVTLAAMHFLLAFLAESWLVDHIIFVKSKKWLKNIGLEADDLPYKEIDHETRHSLSWLPKSAKIQPSSNMNFSWEKHHVITDSSIDRRSFGKGQTSAHYKNGVTSETNYQNSYGYTSPGGLDLSDPTIESLDVNDDPTANSTSDLDRASSNNDSNSSPSAQVSPSSSKDKIGVDNEALVLQI